MKRKLTEIVAAILEADERAAALRFQAEVERSGRGSLDTAARAILRNRRRCASGPNPGSLHGAVAGS